MFISNNDYINKRFIVPTQHIDSYIRDNKEKKDMSYKRKKYVNDYNIFQSMLDIEIDNIKNYNDIREYVKDKKREWRYEI